jgi:hypothetical protein
LKKSWEFHSVADPPLSNSQIVKKMTDSHFKILK